MKRNILITVECKTKYSAYVKMSEDEFRFYDKRIEDSDSRVDEDVFMKFIDCDAHWQDDGNYEIIDFTLEQENSSE